VAFPFPLAPISSTVLFWIPLLEIFHLVRSPNWQSAITGTGRDSFCTISGTGLFQFQYGLSRTRTGLYARGPISGAGLCHFRYSHSGPVPEPELDSKRVVPFPVLGYTIYGSVIHWAPYRNWTLFTWARRGRAAALLLQSIYLDSFVTTHAPEQENEENERSTQYRKWDVSLPVMVPLLEMRVPFPAMVNCAFGYLHIYTICSSLSNWNL
jgi:hypothetical protein